MIRPLFLFLASTPPLLAAGPYPGAAGTPGSDAIPKADVRFISWAVGHIDYVFGSNVDKTWRTPEKAYGPAAGGSFDIVCLGDNGKITLYFPHPVMDGPGPDFAVFENGFGDSSQTFAELAFVEVSSDGVNFYRFPNSSLTASAMGGFGMVDPTNLSGLAGKYVAGFGTPFDLADLPASPLLDRANVRFVRLLDIVGDGNAKDSANHTIYDPYPTTGSAGFDLDAVGVIHQNAGDFRLVQGAAAPAGFTLEWESNPANSYRVETSLTLEDWATVQTVPARSDRGTTLFSVPASGDTQRFWRVTRVEN